MQAVTSHMSHDPQAETLCSKTDTLQLSCCARLMLHWQRAEMKACRNVGDCAPNKYDHRGQVDAVGFEHDLVGTSKASWLPRKSKMASSGKPEASLKASTAARYACMGQ